MTPAGALTLRDWDVLRCFWSSGVVERHRYKVFAVMPTPISSSAPVFPATFAAAEETEVT